MNNDKLQLTFKPYQGKSRKTGKPFNCYQLKIGKWSSLLFTRSSFEKEYLDDICGQDGLIVDFEESK